MKLEPQVTGNIGIDYACYMLSRMGWNVMPTARNARGIDIIAYNKTRLALSGDTAPAVSQPPGAPRPHAAIAVPRPLPTSSPRHTPRGAEREERVTPQERCHEQNLGSSRPVR
jgi:hypothetical protein